MKQRLFLGKFSHQKKVRRLGSVWRKCTWNLCYVLVSRCPVCLSQFNSEEKLARHMSESHSTFTQGLSMVIIVSTEIFWPRGTPHRGGHSACLTSLFTVFSLKIDFQKCDNDNYDQVGWSSTFLGKRQEASWSVFFVKSSLKTQAALRNTWFVIKTWTQIPIYLWNELMLLVVAG